MKVYPLIRRVAPYFRRKRMRAFCSALSITDGTRVLDAGGTRLNWRWAPVQPDVVMLNVVPPERPDARWVIADARQMPFATGTFDVVYSNSVIEHVGDRSGQRRFAEEIQRVAKRYYVQTPYRWFPLEPHLLAPFIHWLPRAWEARLVRYSPWGMGRDAEAHERFMRSVWLLDLRVLRELFPRAEIRKERVLGLTKSIIALGESESYNPPRSTDSSRGLTTSVPAKTS